MSFLNLTHHRMGLFILEEVGGLLFQWDQQKNTEYDNKTKMQLKYKYAAP
jgi:hypothetical protein